MECSKVKYGTRTLAQSALSRGKQDGFYLDNHQVYYCLNCLHFHIGRQRYRAKVSIKRRKQMGMRL